MPGDELGGRALRLSREALTLYRGDLLEGWYQDWCLFERERLQRMYLDLLEQHLVYCETHGEYKLGQKCGVDALRCDLAQERFHRHLMYLYYLSGDRTAALRQYERCEALLAEELEVEPSERTRALYGQIRANRLITPGQVMSRSKRPLAGARSLRLETAIDHLRHLHEAVSEIERPLKKHDTTPWNGIDRKLNVGHVHCGITGSGYRGIRIDRRCEQCERHKKKSD